MANFWNMIWELIVSAVKPPTLPTNQRPPAKPEPAAPPVIPTEQEPATSPIEPTAPVDPITPIPGDRFGSFIITDVYPRDLDNPATPQLDLPPFKVLPGLITLDKEAIGCYVKASEGLGWGVRNEDWFKRCWMEMAKVRDSRKPGTEFHRGCYHFLRFSVDGAKQADYMCDLINGAGGWGEGDLLPWCDVEEGGQGAWAGGEKLEKITDAAKRKRLAAEVTKCTTAFVTRMKQRFPGIKVGIYGRGVFRDLQMSNARFGADAVCNPAYTEKMPPMDKYGWPLEDIIEWQCCGDGEVYAKGYPSLLPGWGRTDYSAVIHGSHRVSLSDVAKRCLAFQK